ncbi:hypothetical protein LRS03_05375 [Rhizobacter sp. J219]|uniref:hypothetical protein n=1 Tax=Rhizobacter sp. J219 TaxID=2898430 RepID=UPI00215134AA|nr:hypothetical protein [Rhizobacter sp. J219]MCR5882321.1 hypothetical protein [Rhizobacter sp. J219]
MEPTPTLEADYVITGAGTTALAFADTLLSDSTATMVIADRRAKPGGHWLDAYPFVRLHGAAAVYGVNSQPLGEGVVDSVGLNQGLNELASGAEICAYFDRLMQQRLLPSGRVTYLSRHEIGADGVATSLVSGRRTRLVARRKWVDAARADSQVPATHGPRFRVAEGVRCVTPTQLTQLAEPASSYVIVGGGKTSIDTALWLLEQGTDPDCITWIRPRDAWLLNRADIQPTLAFAHSTLEAITAELELARDAASLQELFAALEARRLLLRIDPAVEPTKYRCATVSEAELAQLRRIRRVVRLGHVQAIERDRIVFAQGELATSPGGVHVHCSAAGLPHAPVEPIFQGERIVPQYVRRCSPSFSAAFIAHIEATLESDEEKNALCRPVRVPEVPLDWLRMHVDSAANQWRWSQRPALQEWLRRSRLDAFMGLFEQAGRQAASEGDMRWAELQQRLRDARAAGIKRMGELLAA